MYGRNHIKLAFLAAITAGLSAFGQSVSPVVTNGLAEPYGVAVDTDNRYFVTDSVNQRVFSGMLRWHKLHRFDVITVRAQQLGPHGIGDICRSFSSQIITARGWWTSWLRSRRWPP